MEKILRRTYKLAFHRSIERHNVENIMLGHAPGRLDDDGPKRRQEGRIRNPMFIAAHLVEVKRETHEQRSVQAV